MEVGEERPCQVRCTCTFPRNGVCKHCKQVTAASRGGFRVGKLVGARPATGPAQGCKLVVVWGRGASLGGLSSGLPVECFLSPYLFFLLLLLLAKPIDLPPICLGFSGSLLLSAQALEWSVMGL